MGRALEYHSKEPGFAPIEKRFFFSFCLNLSLLKTALSRTHLDVLQRDISIDIGNPMDVGLRHLTRLQKMGDVHPIDRGVLPGRATNQFFLIGQFGHWWKQWKHSSTASTGSPGIFFWRRTPQYSNYIYYMHNTHYIQNLHFMLSQNFSAGKPQETSLPNNEVRINTMCFIVIH